MQNISCKYLICTESKAHKSSRLRCCMASRKCISWQKDGRNMTFTDTLYLEHGSMHNDGSFRPRTKTFLWANKVSPYPLTTMAMSIQVLPLFEQYCSRAYPYMSASVEILSLSRIIQRSTCSRPPSINQQTFLIATLFGCSDRTVSPYDHVVPNNEPLPSTNNNKAKPQVYLQHPLLPPADP